MQRPTGSSVDRSLRAHTRSRRESGTAMLETAIALPLLLLVLFGIFELGLAFCRAQVLTNAAREGAREASLFRASCDRSSVTAQATKTVLDMGARLGMSRGNIDVRLSNVCQLDARVEVTVEYQHAIPVLSGLVKLVGRNGLSGQIPIRAQASMLNEARS